MSTNTQPAQPLQKWIADQKSEALDMTQRDLPNRKYWEGWIDALDRFEEQARAHLAPAPAGPTLIDDGKTDWSKIDRTSGEVRVLPTSEPLRIVEEMQKNLNASRADIELRAVRFLRSLGTQNVESIYEAASGAVFQEAAGWVAAIKMKLRALEASAHLAAGPDEVREALHRCIAAINDYRHQHDTKGKGALETGQAWDEMRKAAKAGLLALSQPLTAPAQPDTLIREAE